MKKILSAALALVCIWFATPARAALPYDYTQLEYIESTGTQYIDTNIPNSDKLKSWIDFSDVSAEQGTLFGGGGGVNGIEFVRSTYGWMARLKDKAFVNTEILNNTTFSDTITLTQNSITSKNFQSSWKLRADTNSISGTMRVFVNVKGNLHGYKLWTNDELVFDGIPAKRNSDGAIGLYDKVTGNLFISKGSESFVAGPETCDGTVVNYTSATGTGVQNGIPTPDNPIYPTFYKQGDMVLRKVGDYADTYDASTGKITRRVGVKVLDGTEDWSGTTVRFSLNIEGTEEGGYDWAVVCSHYKGYIGVPSISTMSDLSCKINQGSTSLLLKDEKYNGNVTAFKAFLAQQYAAGTPVMLYYPLKTETTEDWTESQYCNANESIKIATTKYNETAFGPLNTALQNAISVVDTVVSNTITQAASIATLQTQKQTRPADDPSDANNAENCPAGKKCLLVEDASGIPHWYEIVENAWDLPAGYTQLEYIESTGTQFIDTGYVWASQNRKVDMDVMITTYTQSSHFFASTRDGYDLNPFFADTNSSFTTYIGKTPYIPATSVKDEKNNIVWNLTSDKKFSLQINDRSVGTTTVTAIPTSGVSVYLLHVHSAGNNSWNPLRAKLYQTKMWDNDELVRDFVPAKNPDGKIGMYDLANGVFYENAGTGEFIAGPVAE